MTGMSKPSVFLFSGQGSHHYQMGEDLWSGNEAFRAQLEACDATFKNLVGVSIVDLLYSKERKKQDIFDRTLWTHPSIVTVEYALAKVLIEAGIAPNYVMGASLGELTACALSRVLSFEAMLKITVEQAKTLEAKCPRGGMLAVLNSVDLFEREAGFQKVTLVNVNFSKHFVVSGLAQSILELEKELKQKQIACQSLAVSHAFHSKHIDDAAGACREFEATQELSQPSIPIMSCSRAEVLESIPGGYFWEAVRQPIGFQKSIDALERLGPCKYIDLGPSGTLATFLKYYLPESSTSEIISIMNPFGRDLKRLETLLENK